MSAGDARRLGWLFVAGAIGMSLCDRVHLAFGVITQKGPAILGQAFWVLPLFGAGGVAMVLGQRFARGLLSEPQRAPSLRALAISTAIAGLVYASTGPLQRWPRALALVLVATWIVRVVRRRSPVSLVVSIGTAIFGPLVEITIARAGGHTYAHPDLWRVPMWLPGIYLHGGLLAADIEPFIFRSESARGSPAPAS